MSQNYLRMKIDEKLILRSVPYTELCFTMEYMPPWDNFSVMKIQNYPINQPRIAKKKHCGKVKEEFLLCNIAVLRYLSCTIY